MIDVIRIPDGLLLIALSALKSRSAMTEGLKSFMPQGAKRIRYETYMTYIMKGDGK